MAGCKSSITRKDFYGPYDAQDLARTHCHELGMQVVPSLNLVYTEEQGYITADRAEENNLHVKTLSGTKFRQMLRGRGGHSRVVCLPLRGGRAARSLTGARPNPTAPVAR